MKGVGGHYSREAIISNNPTKGGRGRLFNGVDQLRGGFYSRKCGRLLLFFFFFFGGGGGKIRLHVPRMYMI